LQVFIHYMWCFFVFIHLVAAANPVVNMWITCPDPRVFWAWANNSFGPISQLLGMRV
jgi:hypothetical protein